ncbi:hypothetical protein DMC30DRAFT_120583 [Rhodotorula diobovata]|uniref:Uncharacterized protein n=1 Tax=Rhodotorula diobovata TaxID=5288 RepID=A0A5C5FKY8_9BASI|nr:hypothetical protein DMC30DRAFT_120583 [Rhodotorula diobovata]
MLQRYTQQACRCASTSTARPCRHSLPPIAVAPPTRSHSRSAPSAANAVATQELERPFSYTAPLWRAAPAANERWFGALRPGWTGWLREAHHPPSSHTRPDPPNAPHHPHRNREHALAPPAASSDPASGAAPVIDDAMASRLAAYFAARGPRSTLSSFRDEFGAYLSVAEQADMPLLRAMVLEDALVAETGARRRKLLGMERFATRTGDGEEGGEVGRVVKSGEARPAVLDVRVEQEMERAPRRREGEEKMLTAGADELSLVSEVVESETPPEVVEEELDEPAAAALLRQHVALSPPSGTADTPSAERLAHAWDVFCESADLGDSPSDLSLALSLLLHLASPPPSSAPAPTAAPNLPLALRVLSSLLDVFSDDVVAPSPSGPAAASLPHDARVQVVLLRTAATVALSEDFVALAVEALGALGRVREAHPRLDDVPETAQDSEMVERALERAVALLADESHATYRPSSARTASTSTSSPSLLAQSSSLLRLAARWSAPLTTDTNSPFLPARDRLAPLLGAFAAEAAHRCAWGPLAQHCATWTPRGWVPPPEARWPLKLARWLAGDAPMSTYPDEAPGVRPVRTDDFARFVLGMCRLLRRGEAGRGWTTEDKADWLDLLCSSRAATGRTRAAARALALAWHAAAPPTSTSTSTGTAPFVLRGGTLLALVRTSLPPYTRGGPRAREQAAYLVGAHLSVLAARGSPYARPDGHIAHWDLTTLAQAYALLGDGASAAHVLRRLLEQKIVPDRKDVEAVLVGQARAAATEDRDRAVGLVRTAARFGIRVDYATLEGVLDALLEGVAREGRAASSIVGDAAVESTEERQTRLAAERDKVVASVCDLASTLGATRADLSRLERYAADFLPLRAAAAPPSSSSSPSPPSTSRDRRGPTLPSPAAALHQLRLARASSDYHTARRVFLRAVQGPDLSLRDERALLVALETCDRAYAAAWGSRSKDAVRRAARDVIDAALAPLVNDSGLEGGAAREPTLIVSAKALDAVLVWIIRAGDVPAVDALMDAMRDQAELLGQVEPLSPSEAVEEKVVRWAVGQVGRDEVLQGDGWLAGAATRVMAVSQPAVEQHQEQ